MVYHNTVELRSHNIGNPRAQVRLFYLMQCSRIIANIRIVIGTFQGITTIIVQRYGPTDTLNVTVWFTTLTVELSR